MGISEKRELGEIAYNTGYIEPSTRSPSRLASKRVQKKSKLILLDPGHGGFDTGCTSSSHPNLKEKDVNLDLVHITQAKLQKMGYRISVTRSKDTYLKREKRAEYANQIGANLVVSFHCNWTSKKSVQGVEVFYHKNAKNKTRARRSKRLAEIILKNIMSKKLTVNRGIKDGEFWIVRETNMPAVLVEVGFLSNPKESTLLQSRSYREHIARSIAVGVDQFIKEDNSI